MAKGQRLVDVNPIIEKLSGGEHMKSMSECIQDEIFVSILKNAPVVDAVEVVHGRWLYDSGSGKYFCSACDEYALSFKKDTLYGGDLYEVCLTDYCPNCGAKMDGERRIDSGVHQGESDPPT